MKASQIISEGTLKLEDLLPRLVEALRDDDDKEVVKEVNALTHDLPIFFPDARSWWDGEDPHFLYEQLTDIAQSIAAPFCYFGSHPGDGACIGWFVDVEAVEDSARYSEDVVKIAAGDPMPEWDATEYVAEVSDHGNVTLWQRHMHNGCREWRQVWAIV